MPSTITLSQYTPQPPIQVSDDSAFEVRGWFNRDFLGSDGVTPIEGNPYSGEQGFYYSISASLNADNEVVVAAHDIQVTTESNPTANYFEGLWIDGAFFQMLIPNTQGATGWQISSLTDPINFGQLALYNRAKRLVYPPSTYWTADEVLLAIQQYAGDFDYMAVGVNGIGSIDTAPALASLPIVIGTNSRRAPDFYNIIAYGASTSLGAAANALAIAAAVTAAASAGGGIYIPVGTFATNSVTISVPVQFAPGASILSPATGQTLTITKAISADISKHFGNATAGLGTVSFSGNVSLTQAPAAWWGALPSASATINAAALNATNAALVTIGSGEILLGPGTYDFNATFNLGSDAVAFTGISLGGTNGRVGSTLRWAGSTSGTAIYLTRGRDNHLHDFQLTSSVAKGTTNGLRISGPSVGTNTSGVVLDRVDINTFNVGLLLGNGASGGFDASEVTLNSCTLEANNTGLAADGSNTLNIHLYSTNVDNNTNIGLDVQTAGSLHVYGGAFGRNPISIKTASTGALFVSGVRDEMNASAIFIFSTGSGTNAEITVVGCDLDSSDVVTPLIQGFGAFSLIGNRFGSVGSAVIPFTGNSGAHNSASLFMTGNSVNENATLFKDDAQAVGMTYHVSGNVKIKNDGNANGKWDDEEGIVDNSGLRVVTKKLSGLYTARIQYLANVRINGALVKSQATPSTPTTAATLTIANLLIGILTATPTATGATVAYTLPTGTNMSGGATFATNDSFDWSITNLAAASADTITLTANTDHTIVGNPIIQSANAASGGIYGNAAMFRSRKVSATVWVTYRLS